MPDAPVPRIDPAASHAAPYPTLAAMRATFPPFSPRMAMMDHRLAACRSEATAPLADPAPRGQAGLVAEFAMPVAGHALHHITGLTNMTWQT